MLVKCRACGEKIDRKIAYKVTNEKKNEYYCNEKKYLAKVHAKNLKSNTYNKISDIFGYTVTNTAIYKEINALEKVHGFQKIYDVLCYYQWQFDAIMAKTFNSEYAKIRYFSVVLKNKIEEGIPIFVPSQTVAVVDIPEIKYKSRPKRKSLSELELEVGEDD